MRAIIEALMLDVMFEVPSRDDVSHCVVTEQVVLDKIQPELINKEGKAVKRKEESA